MPSSSSDWLWLLHFSFRQRNEIPKAVWFPKKLWKNANKRKLFFLTFFFLSLKIFREPNIKKKKKLTLEEKEQKFNLMEVTVFSR